MNLTNVKVQHTDNGTDVLLPNDAIEKLGWNEVLERGPIVFGQGRDKCTIRPAEETKRQTANT